MNFQVSNKKYLLLLLGISLCIIFVISSNPCFAQYYGYSPYSYNMYGGYGMYGGGYGMYGGGYGMYGGGYGMYGGGYGMYGGYSPYGYGMYGSGYGMYGGSYTPYGYGMSGSGYGMYGGSYTPYGYGMSGSGYGMYGGSMYGGNMSGGGTWISTPNSIMYIDSMNLMMPVGSNMNSSTSFFNPMYGLGGFGMFGLNPLMGGLGFMNPMLGGFGLGIF